MYLTQPQRYYEVVLIIMISDMRNNSAVNINERNYEESEIILNNCLFEFMWLKLVFPLLHRDSWFERSRTRREPAGSVSSDAGTAHPFTLSQSASQVTSWLLTDGKMILCACFGFVTWAKLTHKTFKFQIPVPISIYQVISELCILSKFYQFKDKLTELWIIEFIFWD